MTFNVTKTSIVFHVLISAVFIFLLSSSLVLAQGGGADSGQAATTDPLDPFGGAGPTISPTFDPSTYDEPTSVTIDAANPPTAPRASIQLFDPVDMSIEEIFLAILDIITVFAIPIILFFIVWAGFLYVTAAGDATKVQKATVALTYAVVGALLVLGARIILAVITNTIDTFNGS